MHVHTIQLNIEKLIGGTVHMDASEFGAYMSLIVAAYQSGNKLPNDDKRLSRMARVTGHKWAKIKGVVLEKFTLNGDFYEQNFIKKDLERMESLSEKNRDNRLKGLEKQKRKVKRTKNEKETNTNNKEQISIKNYNKKDFLDFWDAYPRQIDLGDAEEAFIDQLNEGEDPEEIINAAKAYAKEQADNEKKYIKSPVTFLDKKVFKSPEYNKPTATPITLDDKPEWMKKIGENIGPAATISWFSGCELTKSGVLTVESEFKRKWISENYQNAIKSAGVKKIEVKKS